MCIRDSESVDHVFEIGLRRKLDRKAAQARRSRRRGSRTPTCPLVQPEVMMVATRRDESHPWDMAHHVEADEIVIEPQRVVDIRHVQVDMTHLRSTRHRRVQAVVGLEVAEELLHIDRVTA